MALTTLEVVEYYANLLILQYIGKPKAWATIKTSASPIVMPQTTVQQITFDPAPASGTFVLSYNDINSSSINWNDSAATIQTNLRAITGLSAILVTGTIADGLTVTFEDVLAPAESLILVSSSMVNGSDDVVISIVETDETLPLAVQNGFNFAEGSTLATGVQLDVIGDYAGVVRSGFGFTQNIVLNDDDFAVLIRMAIFKNSAGSDLSTIQTFLNTYFPGQILVWDYTTMRMSYLLKSGIGSQDLLEMFVTQGLLPRPMAVRIDLIIYPIIDSFFGFSDYSAINPNVSPFNDYNDYQTDWHWLAYEDVSII